jgi:hypothetical protein
MMKSYRIYLGIRCYGGSNDKEKAIASAQRWANKYPEQYVRVEEVEVVWRNKVVEFDAQAILRESEPESEGKS